MAGGAQQDAQPKGGLFNRIVSPRNGGNDSNLPSSSGTAVSPSNNQSPLPIAPPSVNKVEYAIALFDNEVDDEEELGL